MVTRKAKKTTRRKSRKRTRSKAPSGDPDFPIPTFQPDADDPKVIRIGRPPLDVDPAQVFRVAQCHSTYEEIAFIIGCSVDTLERRFADIIKLARTQENISTRRLQFAIAHGSFARFGDKRKLRGPNAEMAKWLGKQHLGQRDRVLVQNQDVAPIVETYIPDNGRGMVSANGELTESKDRPYPIIEDIRTSDEDRTE